MSMRTGLTVLGTGMADRTMSGYMPEYTRTVTCANSLNRLNQRS